MPVALGLARGVNTVFNYCNELSVELSSENALFVGIRFLGRSSKGSRAATCALQLPVQAVQEIAEEYARRRRQHRKVRLAWRRSRGARRSLGWIPFKSNDSLSRGAVTSPDGWLSLWDSYGLATSEFVRVIFSEDSRGTLVSDICVPARSAWEANANKPVRDRSSIARSRVWESDLGLPASPAFSDDGSAAD